MNIGQHRFCCASCSMQAAGQFDQRLQSFDHVTMTFLSAINHQGTFPSTTDPKFVVVVKIVIASNQHYVICHDAECFYWAFSISVFAHSANSIIANDSPAFMTWNSCRSISCGMGWWHRVVQSTWLPYLLSQTRAVFPPSSLCKCWNPSCIQ
jgi:hypothetical protein